MNDSENKGSVLLVDDEPNIVKTVRICLESAGYEITSFLNPLQALDAMREHAFDIAFYDLKMQPMDGMELLRQTRRISPDTTVIIMTAHGSIDSAVEAIKEGAYDYLQKPFEFSELQHFTEKVHEHRALVREVRDLRDELHRRTETDILVTRSENMRAVVNLAMQVAPSGIPVLIEGESGTGKELLAHL
ncbi:MAG TPA: response regulator, partial [Bacteroidota bacterium]|nr:response regulator [Bacteroidota bacterium]